MLQTYAGDGGHMLLALLLIAAWFALSLPLGVVVGRSIARGQQETAPTPVGAEAVESERIAA